MMTNEVDHDLPLQHTERTLHKLQVNARLIQENSCRLLGIIPTPKIAEEILELAYAGLRWTADDVLLQTQLETKSESVGA